MARRLRVMMGVVLVGMAVLTGCARPLAWLGGKPKIHFDNAYFYDGEGKFLPERGKDAYVALMKYHGYPVYQGMREQIWVSDYGTGQFAKLGLGARMWKNHTEHYFMLMDLFLLPNQMLPEHWHVKPDKLPVKLEGWLIRYGSSHVVGEGEPNLSPQVVIPKCHKNGTATVAHEVLCGPGDFASLNRATAHHWQFGGPQGCILTEVANCHVDSAVRHLDPAINKHFLGE